MMILVNGGSSSGKSAFAESLIMEEAKREQNRLEAEETGGKAPCQPSWYLATMIAWDEECRERIRKHREMRAEKHFRTIECPVDIGTADVPENSLVLLECLSNLAANEMYRENIREPEKDAKNRIIKGIEKIRKKAKLLVIVTNDVSGDQGTYSEETERYRRLLGSINRMLAAQADAVYDVTCSIPVRLKGLPQTEVSDTGEEKMEKTTSGITLFTGGAYQGKTKLALKEAEGKRENHVICVANGEMSAREEAFASEAVLNLHMYIRRMIDDAMKHPEKAGIHGHDLSLEEWLEVQMRRFLDEILAKNPDAVITCDEIGCGVVPVEKRDRLWREMTGDACQYLAAHAKKVCRVVCGIPEVLKGGEA